MVRLTFTAVIIDHKRFAYSFTDPGAFITIRPGNNSGTKPELPAPDPARVVREFNISDGCSAVPESYIHVAMKQRPPSSPLFHNVSIKFIRRPVLFIARKIAIQRHNFYFNWRRNKRRQISAAVLDGNPQRLIFHIRDLTSGENLRRYVIHKIQLITGRLQSLNPQRRSPR